MQTIRPVASFDDVAIRIKETMRYPGNIAPLKACLKNIAERLASERSISIHKAARLIWYDLLIDDTEKWYVNELKNRMK